MLVPSGSFNRLARLHERPPMCVQPATLRALGSLRTTEGFPLERFSASGHEWQSTPLVSWVMVNKARIFTIDNATYR
jgi:hypothetical protein